MDLIDILTHLPSKYDGCAIDKIDYGKGVEQGKTFERKNKNEWEDCVTGKLYTNKELARELEKLKIQYEKKHDEGCIRFYRDWSPFDYEEIEEEIEKMTMKGHKTILSRHRASIPKLNIRKMF